MTITEIKAAVDAGLSVKWETDNYDVCKSEHGEYLIVCQTNGSTVGLHGLEGTEYEHDLNGDPDEFFVEFSSPRLADPSDRLAWRNLQDIHLPSLTEDDAQVVIALLEESN